MPYKILLILMLLLAWSCTRDRRESALNKGIALYEQSQPDSAVKYLELAAQQDTANALIFDYLGHCYVKMQRYDKAVKDYEKAIRLGEDSSAMYNNAGDSYYHLNDTANAEACFLTAKRKDSTNPVSYLNLGIIYSGRKDYRKAIENFKKAIKYNPADPQTYYSLSVALQYADRSKEALEAINHALRFSPADDTYLTKKSSIEGSMALYEDAVKDATAAININRNNADAIYVRALAYRQLNELDKSCEDYHRLLAIAPGTDLSKTFPCK